jgi:hypothetical protein
MSNSRGIGRFFDQPFQPRERGDNGVNVAVGSTAENPRSTGRWPAARQWRV